ARMASAKSTTGNFRLTGTSKPDWLLAWKRLKKLGGAIVVVHAAETLIAIPPPLGGLMDDGDMTELIRKENDLKKLLEQFGYPFGVPIYSILFLSSTHLPYIRITQQGVLDIMKKEVLFPSTMR